ncbi:MAG: hypothetical protein ACK5LX_01910 [Oscillospiraceae bacterium]
MKKEEQDIGSIGDLVGYLTRKGGNRRSYYHYTTLDTLYKIVTPPSNSFFLTRGNSMRINDWQEPNRGKKSEWDHVYLACFSAMGDENMAMWGLYGLPKQSAIRIEIPGAAMRRWINSSHKAYRILSEEVLDESPLVHLTDVAYISGEHNGINHALFRDGEYMRNVEQSVYKDAGFNRSPEIAGFIKARAWQYEREVRIRVRTNKATGMEQIALPLPKDTIQHMTVMTGPNFDHGLAENKSLLRKIRGCIANVVPSDFTGQLHYQSLCDLCVHEQFEKKE